MAKRSLKPQLNQIRAWVQEGRTDAWIAHQLEISAAELKEFRRQHDLAPGEGDNGAAADVDLRDEIEAEIEAAAAEEEALEAARAEEAAEEAEEEAEADGDQTGTPERPARRRRRRDSASLEGTFDHGEEGYGLWLDPAIEDLPAYRDNWAGHREVTVTVEDDRIVIRRAD
jgi:hypothetical protein